MDDEDTLTRSLSKDYQLKRKQEKKKLEEEEIERELSEFKVNSLKIKNLELQKKELASKIEVINYKINQLDTRIDTEINKQRNNIKRRKALEQHMISEGYDIDE